MASSSLTIPTQRCVSFADVTTAPAAAARPVQHAVRTGDGGDPALSDSAGHGVDTGTVPPAAAGELNTGHTTAVVTPASAGTPPKAGGHKFSLPSGECSRCYVRGSVCVNS